MPAMTCGWGTAEGTPGPGETYTSLQTQLNFGLSGKEKGQVKMDNEK